MRWETVGVDGEHVYSMCFTAKSMPNPPKFHASDQAQGSLKHR